MKRYVSYIVLLFSIVIISCDDIIEQDITNDLITIISPQEGVDIQGNTVQFRWNGIDGADEYRLQVNNNITNTVAIDSLITNTLVDFTMTPSSYSWRVRGENFAYVTPFTFDNTFTVSESDVLTDQTVILSSPSNNVYFNATTVPLEYSWEAISAATSYNMKISKTINNTTTEVYPIQSIATNTNTVGSSVVSGEGEYSWEIQAVNEGNSTQTEFATFTFFVDVTKPAAPTLNTPSDADTESEGEEITFSWTYTDEGEIESGVSYTIQIADDSDFNNIIETETKITALEYKYAFEDKGTYFWKVKGTDDAENEGIFSVARQIIIE